MGERIVAVGALITDEDGRILLILRRNEPSAGHWSLPGGKVEPGESLRQAVIREVEEETGLVVEVGEPAIQLDIPVGDGRVYEVHDFRAEIRSGELCPGDDAADAAYFTPAEVRTAKVTSRLVEYLEQAGALPPEVP
ncbi:NUDIX hydrolase [Gordonia sp. HS-NH1]|uniref:NUDIX hydrolase n=1 Tax=Gordonia sp. HS-NH1 TaxID=1435068 RepID=UPI0006E1A7B1|nr:NUDIX hydrolase [Gordonia sp. HS-NH1]